MNNELISLEVVDEVWCRLTFTDGQIWEVSRRQTGPVGIGEAETLAKAEGLDLPSPKEVDTIWACADLKIEPRPRSFQYWTATEMNNPIVYAEQAAYVDEQIAGCDFILLAGEFKDVVRGPCGRTGLYGWHRLNGKPVQSYFPGHVAGWKDYSQGLRLIRHIA